MSILDEIKEETKKDHGYVVELRRYFHSHPELSRQEFNTANKIEEELDKLGISHKSCLLYTFPSPRDRTRSRMPSSA